MKKMEIKPLRPSALLIAGGVLVVVGMGMVLAPDAPWMETLVIGSVVALAGAVVALCQDSPPGDSDELQIARMKHDEEMAKIAAGSPAPAMVTEETAVKLVEAVK